MFFASMGMMTEVRRCSKTQPKRRPNVKRDLEKLRRRLSLEARGITEDLQGLPDDTTDL
jgi:hypothetical protein